jgi:hypothetical protein
VGSLFYLSDHGGTAPRVRGPRIGGGATEHGTGRTLLHYAARSGNTHVVEYLFMMGARALRCVCLGHFWGWEEGTFFRSGS